MASVYEQAIEYQAEQERRLRARIEELEAIVALAHAAVMAWADMDESTTFDAEMTELDVAIGDYQKAAK